MIPDGAKFLTDIGEGVAVYDVSHLLQKHATKKYKTRDPKKIDTLALHKTGADGSPGFKGLVDCTRYVIGSRDFPGMPYTWWNAKVPDTDPEGRIVVYQGQPLTAVSWHTGGIENTRGVALSFQGNYDSEWDLLSTGMPKIEIQPSPAQWKVLDRIVAWLKFDRIVGHFEAGHIKPVCPGDAVKAWILARRGILRVPMAESPVLPAASSTFAYLLKPTPKQLQQALKDLGYYTGAIDGQWGHGSRTALEKFQAAEHLHVDGVYGPKTAEALIAEMDIDF